MIPVKYNLRSIRARWVGSVMTIAGSALAVWASVLAFGLAAGLNHTLQVSGEPLDILVMRQGATAETNSILTEELSRQLAALSGMATNADGQVLYSPELVYIENASRRGDSGKGNLIIRGVTPVAPLLRKDFKIVAGRLPEPGLREAITSRNIADRFRNAGFEETLSISDKEFKIVGLFEAGGGAAESEVWVDLSALGQATGRSGFLSSAQIRAADDARREALLHKIENDEQFAQKAIAETKYFAEQAESGSALRFVGWIIAFFLILGSTFAVANTMYGAIASRAREIGTLRALGFPRRDILLSFLLESIVICLLGGLLGCLLTIPVNGLQTGTANWATFSELTFAFRFGPDVLLEGLLLSLAMGVVGGLFPAVRAVRMKVVDALRET